MRHLGQGQKEYPRLWCRNLTRWINQYRAAVHDFMVRSPPWPFLSATERCKRRWSGLLTRLLHICVIVYNINLLEWLDLGRLSNLCDAQVELTKSGNGMVEKLSEIQVSFCNPWSGVIESFSDQWNRSKLPVKFDQHPWPYLELWPSQACVQIWSWNRWDQGSICIHTTRKNPNPSL